MVDEAPKDFAPIADPVGEWIADLSKDVKEERVSVEVAKGSPVDDMLRRVAATNFGALTAAEAEQLMRVAKALEPPAKRGAKTKLETLWKIQGIAWLAVHEPTLRGRALAVRLGTDVSTLRDFCKDNRSAIRSAIQLLKPSLPANR